MMVVFQPTRPLRGATSVAFGMEVINNDFNPRAPCGARHYGLVRRYVFHHFNPRAPCGARPPDGSITPVADDISTHAPLAGRDADEILERHVHADFNPRAPCGARPNHTEQEHLQFWISTHAPLAGRDCPCRKFVGVLHISTHAPLAGRDSIVKFNNRFHVKISTHAPLAGRDRLSAFDKKRISISTHAPLAGRDFLHFDTTFHEIISTHAPLAGRDVKSVLVAGSGFISTHAPLAGRDKKAAEQKQSRYQFQPTRPLRGATSATKPPTSLFDFNPRAPCGARQQKCTNHYAHFCDNRQISDAFAQNAACQGILLLFDAGKPCGFWVRTAQVISARLCFAL